jgi:phenylpyruvate tautomerase PptA (4-oxalocrotonate tautomerase family)
MPIIPYNQLDEYIEDESSKIVREMAKMLEHFRHNRTSKERVIENVTRLLIDIMNTIEESDDYGAQQNNNYPE